MGSDSGMTAMKVIFSAYTYFYISGRDFQCMSYIFKNVHFWQTWHLIGFTFGFLAPRGCYPGEPRHRGGQPQLSLQWRGGGATGLQRAYPAALLGAGRPTQRRRGAPYAARCYWTKISCLGCIFYSVGYLPFGLNRLLKPYQNCSAIYKSKKLQFFMRVKCVNVYCQYKSSTAVVQRCPGLLSRCSITCLFGTDPNKSWHCDSFTSEKKIYIFLPYRSALY